MPQDKITPEEKLLRLIENPAQVTQVRPKAKKVKFNIFSFFAILSPKKLISAMQQLFKNKDKLKPHFLNLKFANMCLTALCALVTLYLMIDFILSNPRPKFEKISAYASTGGSSLSMIKAIPEIRAVDITDFMSQITTRDIFNLLPVKKEEVVPQAKDTLSALVADLKLVGIIWSAKPQAMVEDKKENKTLLLNESDMIGQIKVKQILRDKVILGYEDQEIELL